MCVKVLVAGMDEQLKLNQDSQVIIQMVSEEVLCLFLI